MAAAEAACTSWTTLYSHAEKMELAPKNLLTVLPVRPKEWQVKFELQPSNFDYDANCLGGNMCDILYMTNLCQHVSKWDCVGSQIPRVMYEKDQNMTLALVTASNGNGNFYGGSWKMSTPAIGAWTTIEMSQELTDGKYMVKQVIDGSLVHSWENKQPQSFENVSVYAYKAEISQAGFIRGLFIQGKGNIFKVYFFSLCFNSLLSSCDKI